MMRWYRGRVFVEGRLLDGGWGQIDVVDLDELSFRGWVVEQFILFKRGSEAAMPGVGTGGPREYRQRRPEVHQPTKPNVEIETEPRP